MTAVVGLTLAMFAVSAVLVLVRLVRGPSVADRAVALDFLLCIAVVAIAVGAAATARRDLPRRPAGDVAARLRGHDGRGALRRAA